MNKIIEKRLRILEGHATDFIAIGSTKTLNANDHANRTFKLDTLAGSIAILPPATGSGVKYTFYVSVVPTSNSHIVKCANASDSMQGFSFSRDDTSQNAVSFFATAGTDDTVTLNRSTTGGVSIGEKIEVIDFAANRYQVEAMVSNTGSQATPFSATVS